ncbi:MAG: hypothetical protein HFG18_04975 [Oscillospiraceae bacterium]|nr:hypothetical protein [Oscillospiraceae bacterium]
MSKSRKNKAVALRYRVEEDAAPVVIASGYGNIAEKIVDIAEQQGIPVFRDDSAASLLCMLEVGKNIPPELYEVIAAIYAQILRVSKEIKASAPIPAPRSSGVDALRERVAAGVMRQQRPNSSGR